MFYVYILYSSETGRLYKGFSNNLKERIYQHKSGQVKSTKHIHDWELIYYQAFKNETDARREEIFLKSGKGRTRLKYLLEKTLESFQDQSRITYTRFTQDCSTRGLIQPSSAPAYAGRS